MEKFQPEESPPEEEKGTAKDVSRRRFLKFLGLGAAGVITGSVLDSQKEAAAESGPKTGFQIVDGRAVLLRFDASGKVESYEIVGAVGDLGLSSQDTNVMFSAEVIQAAKKLVDTGKQCRQGDIEACRSVGMAKFHLQEAIRVYRDLPRPKEPPPRPKIPTFKPPPPAISL